MKISLIALMLAAVCSNASAQDSRDRQRQPPGSGTNQSGGPRTDGNQSGDSNDGPRRDERPQSGGSGYTQSGGSHSSGAARRRVPRVDGGTLDAVRNSRTNPGAVPTQGPDGSSLGHAVRRDSIPPSSYSGNFDDLDPRGWNERERRRYYWHEHRGHRWCHYVDGYGDDWYYWYHGNDYYTMRYIDGRWWRYDPGHGRWVWLHNGGWYYQQGPTVYHYEESSGQYQDADAGVYEPIVPPKIAVTVNLGRFGLNAGDAGSVVKENQSYLDFDGAVGGVSASAEVNVGLGNHLEAGLGVGYVDASANSMYRDYVRDNGTDIRQQTRLRNVPMNVNIKLMPWGRDKEIQPYVGAGLQVNNWNYEESGQFIDFNSANYDIYKDTYKADGVAVGPVAIVGLRIPLNKTVSISGEYRRQWAKGALPAEGGFVGDHVDLGGETFQAGVTINIK